MIPITEEETEETEVDESDADYVCIVMKLRVSFNLISSLPKCLFSSCSQGTQFHQHTKYDFCV